jgi:hypothetical protein
MRWWPNSSKTADVDAGHGGDRVTGIQRNDDRRREHEGEVDLPAGDLVEQGSAGFRFDVIHVGEAFRPQ